MFFDFINSNGIIALRTDRHRLAGFNYINEVLGRALIVIRYRNAQEILASAVSDASTGAWQIYGLPEYPLASLIVELLDSTGTYNAEVADYVSQVTW